MLLPVLLQASATGKAMQQLPSTPAADSDSDSDAEPQKKGKKGKRDRGQGQHKVTKRTKSSGAGSFFADLL